MDKNNQKIIPLSLGVLALSLFLAYLLHATWTEPTEAPPAGNPVLADRLYVYKNDGVTRLGIFFRRKTGDRGPGFHCNWGFAPPTGGIRWLSDYDRLTVTDLPCLAIYFSDPGCTGSRRYAGGGKLVANSRCNGRRYARTWDNRIIRDAGHSSITVNSRRLCCGTCEEIPARTRGRVPTFVQWAPPLCGAGPCVIK